MGKIDRKLEQIKLQHQIGKLLLKDSGVSSHFDYYVDLTSREETVKLNVLTFKEKHNEYMLMHTVKGSSSIDCLEKMLHYIKIHHQHPTEYSFTVKWKKKSENADHVSYFRGEDEEEAKSKFLHEKNPKDYDFSIVKNPVA